MDIENKEINTEGILKENYENLTDAEKAPLLFAAKKLLNEQYTMLLFGDGKNVSKLRLPTEYPDLIPEDVFHQVTEAIATMFMKNGTPVFALKKTEGRGVDVVGLYKDDNGSFKFLTADETQDAFNFNKGMMQVTFCNFPF